MAEDRTNWSRWMVPPNWVLLAPVAVPTCLGCFAKLSGKASLSHGDLAFWFCVGLIPFLIHFERIRGSWDALQERVQAIERKVGDLERPTAQRRKAAALGALADEIRNLPTIEGRLSLTNAEQVEWVARQIENGADEAAVREAMKRIREGETLAETLRRL
jgi:hypothetical protein